MRRPQIPLTPLLLIGAANALVGFGEDHPGRSRGRLVHRFLKEVGVDEGAGADMAWDAAFVHHAGYWSHFDERMRRSAWPLPLSPSREDLGEFASEEGVLAEHPVRGDLFLLWAPAKREFVRTGIIIEVEGKGFYTNGQEYHECVTIEGDSNATRGPRGGQILRQLRVFSAERGDRFVRWTALEVGEVHTARVDQIASPTPDEEPPPRVLEEEPEILVDVDVDELAAERWRDEDDEEDDDDDDDEDDALFDAA
jgi:hypothetical protein